MNDLQQHLSIVANEIASGQYNIMAEGEAPAGGTAAGAAKDAENTLLKRTWAHLKNNKGKYALGAAGAGALAGGGYYAYNRNNNEVAASEYNDIQAGVFDPFKKFGGAVKSGFKSNSASKEYGKIASGRHNAKLTPEQKSKMAELKGVARAGNANAFKDAAWYEKAGGHLGRNAYKYGAGAAAAGAGGGGYYAYNRNRNNQVSAMEYFTSITAAEYLEDKLDGQLGFNVTAADYEVYNNISAMEYLIRADEESAALAEASDEVKEALAEAETPEEVEAILQDNAAVAEGHADKAEEQAEIADQGGEGADEAAALAEYHADKAGEAAEVENDVISALYYDNSVTASNNVTAGWKRKARTFLGLATRSDKVMNKAGRFKKAIGRGVTAIRDNIAAHKKAYIIGGATTAVGAGTGYAASRYRKK